jgi:hypothetical protein
LCYCFTHWEVGEVVGKVGWEERARAALVGTAAAVAWAKVGGVG